MTGPNLSNPTDPRIPVTLLTGFLGAGKTTVLNSLLNDSASGRIAVIVNEFGEAGLDHDLMETASDDVVLMKSGCLCCTVRGELAETITALLNRRHVGDLDFDRVVIETTGLADPGPILQTMLVDRSLARAARVDGVVTLADAANGPATLDAQFEAVSQAAVADLIVISKTDLVDPTRLVTFEERLRGLNPTARIVHSVKGAGVAEQIWGLSGIHVGVSPQKALDWMRPAGRPEGKVDPLANLSGLAGTDTGPAAGSAPFSPHDSRIGSASIILEEPISDKVFDNWLNTLISLRGSDILRVKGIVFLKGIDLPFVFHGVQNIFDPPLPVRGWPGGDRTSRIVVIARDITRPELQRSFDMLRATSTTTPPSTPTEEEAKT